MVDYTGQKFERLTVIGIDPAVFRRGKMNYVSTKRWLCRCDCGNIRSYEIYILKAGKVKSCGCYKRDNPGHKTHGMSNTGIYRCWHEMHRRCYDTKRACFKNYGGRGIKVCGRWRVFDNFLKDMGRPSANLEIERINNDGDYEPYNCRWATLKEQARNKRTSRMITRNGVTKCLAAWAEEAGIPSRTLWSRLSMGWNIERALLAYDFRR